MTHPAVSTACSGIVCGMAVIGQRLDVGHDKEFMSTLAKGLAVLGAFGKERPSMTLSDAAAIADLSRATARRVLRTLAQLGYVVQDGRTFSLTPRVLELGFAYLSGQDWIDRALPILGISDFWQGAVVGALILGSICLDRLLSLRRAHQLIEARDER